MVLGGDIGKKKSRVESSERKTVSNQRSISVVPLPRFFTVHSTVIWSPEKALVGAIALIICRSGGGVRVI
jgi:hypothetical protein